MAYLDTLKPLKIDGLRLPYRRIRVRGGMRDHVHEFPHVPGGLPEKLGRKLYEIEISLLFDDALMSAPGSPYAGRNLYANLNVLQGRWDEGRKAKVYLPNIGEIAATYATSWTREIDVKLRSGEQVELTLREDSDAASMIANTLKSAPTAALAVH